MFWSDPYKKLADRLLTDEYGARQELIRIGQPAVRALCAAARSNHWALRRRAIDTLAEIGGPATVPALIRALDDIREVAGPAASALRKVKDARVTDALAAALRREGFDLVSDIGLGLAWALLDHGHRLAVSYFIAAMSARPSIVSEGYRASVLNGVTKFLEAHATKVPTEELRTLVTWTPEWLGDGWPPLIDTTKVSRLAAKELGRRGA